MTSPWQHPDGLWAHWFWGSSSIDGRIEPLAENRLRFPGIEEMDFGVDGNVRLKDRGSGMRLRSMEYTRVSEYQPKSADLLQFSGTYWSKELDVPLLVSVDGPRLVLRKPKAAPCPLVALASDIFVGSGMRVRFTRDSGRAVSGFLLSGRWNRVQNLRFERMAAP